MPPGERRNAAHQQGHAWGDMAVIGRRYDEMDECTHVLNRARLPHEVRNGAGSFRPNEGTIKVLTMHASKELEFAVVVMIGYGKTEGLVEDVAGEVAQLFYMAVARAVHHIYLIRKFNDRPTF